MRVASDGPTITYGCDNPQQKSNTDAGPNVDFQGNALLDSRFVSTATEQGSAAVVPAWFGTSSLEVINAVPQAASTANVVPAANTTAATAMTLAGVAAGISTNVPIVPYGTAIQPTSAIVTAALAIAFGKALGTTTTPAATATTVTLTGPTSAAFASSTFQVGEKIVIPNAGNAAGTVALLTYVTATPFRSAPGVALAAAGTITIANPALAVVTAGAIGTADPMFGVGALPMSKAGAVGVWDPSQMLSRVLQYTSAGVGTGTITVKGYDVYGQAMTEVINTPNTTTTNGKKAFKYITSVTPSTSMAFNVSVGVADVFGYPMRTDLWEFTSSFWNLAFLAAPTTFVAGDTTSPATTSTGDVRGTIGVPSVSDGTKRLVVYANPRYYQCVNADNINPATLAGVTQV